MFAHFAAHVSDDDMAILEFYPKLGIGQRLNDFAREFNHFFLTSHKLQM